MKSREEMLQDLSETLFNGVSRYCLVGKVSATVSVYLHFTCSSFLTYTMAKPMLSTLCSNHFLPLCRCNLLVEDNIVVRVAGRVVHSLYQQTSNFFENTTIRRPRIITAFWAKLFIRYSLSPSLCACILKKLPSWFIDNMNRKTCAFGSKISNHD